MADVFISYSREDQKFVRHLHGALAAQDRDTWVDWEGIPPTAEWMKEIYMAIDSANTFVFVMSPDSMASDVCRQEIEYAAKQHKRLVPLVNQEVDSADVPDSLRKLNWIFFRDQDDFNAAFQTLIKAIDTDLDWVRSHTRLLVRSKEWETKHRSNSFILRGEDLKEAEQWLAQSAEKEPNPVNIQTQYILSSRKATTKRQKIIFGVVTFGLIVALILAGIVIWLWNEDITLQYAGSIVLARLHLVQVLEPDMIAISGGTFEQGDFQGLERSREQPVRKVTIMPIALGKFEVTFEGIRAVCRND